MSIKLRPYQTSAITKLYSYWAETQRNGVIVLPTGTGKSILIAEPCRSIVSEYPQTRIIIATHSQELVAQNFQELIRLWPEAPAGIYSAGLNQRKTRDPILFVGIQSVYNKAFVLQRCDILLVDECHTISRKAQTMWGKFISDLKIINPNMRVVGLSATPYRMDSGNLTDGDGIFQDVIYEYNILEAFEDGFLCPVIPKDMATKFNVEGVGKSGGEFIEKQLQAAVNIDSITEKAVNEIMEWGNNRRSWLIFGSGVDHAISICEELKRRGVPTDVVTGDTLKPERAAILERFKRGHLRALCNNKVLTTGFNVPGIDLIADMNPTLSAGLFVQKIGRGTRPLYAPGFDIETKEGRIEAIAASIKPNCLLLDFANNLPRHGHIDKIKGKAPPVGGGIAPTKPCPGKLPAGELCATILHAAAMICPQCGFKFPEPELKIAPVANDHAVISTQESRKVLKVMSIRYNHHKKVGGTDSVRVEYMGEGFKRVSEWVCIQHKRGTLPFNSAAAWWKRRAQGTSAERLPMPDTVATALALAGELLTPVEIVVVKEGKFDRIVAFKFEPGVKVPIFIDNAIDQYGATDYYPPEIAKDNYLAECEDIGF